MADKKILIVGAGLGGLAAASCLMKAGFNVEVYEQSPVLAEVGAGIQMSANPMHVLRYLGLDAEVSALGVRPGAYVFRLHDTGEVIQEFALSAEHERQHGAPYVQLHRADLHELLAATARKLKPDAIRLSRRATGFTETDTGVTLHFADGSAEQGDILVGADGLKSTIARQIVGEVQATYTGDAAWRITVPVERLPKPFLPQVMSVFMGPGGHAVCYYLRGGALSEFRRHRRDRAGDFRRILDREISLGTASRPTMPAGIRRSRPSSMPPTTTSATAGRCTIVRRSRNWSTRRATILGDSAHATLPYLAQGAAMAIEDGAVLARALRQENDIAEALDLYQRNRVDRTARIVEQSTQNRWLFHLPSQEAMREEFSKRNQGEERNRWLYSYNPLTVELT